MATYLSTEDCFNMVNELLNHEGDDEEEKLTEWELDFLDSVNDRRDFLLIAGLSTKQKAVIDKTWTRIFGD